MNDVTARTMTIREVRALAHPLRLRLLDLLSEGPSTASRLAAETGESSGATSYHLRALAAGGLVEEEADRGTARERWWRRVAPPGLIATGPDEGEEYRTAGLQVRGAMLERDDEALRAFLEHEDRLDAEWQAQAFIGSWSIHATAAEIEDLSRRVLELLFSLRRAPGERPDDAVPVQISWRALPHPPRRP